MATHYVYDDPDKKELAQGDILQRTPALVALLNQYHPHYAPYVPQVASCISGRF